MRRILAVAALGMALSAVSACADPAQETPGASNSPSVAASPTKALADKKTTCDAYKTLAADIESKSMAFAPVIMGAASDPTKIPALITAVTPVFKDYETKLAPLAANAGDPAVKAALDAEATAIKGLNTEIAAAGSDPAKLKAVVDKIVLLSQAGPQQATKKACGIESK